MPRPLSLPPTPQRNTRTHSRCYPRASRHHPSVVQPPTHLHTFPPVPSPPPPKKNKSRAKQCEAFQCPLRTAGSVEEVLPFLFLSPILFMTLPPPSPPMMSCGCTACFAMRTSAWHSMCLRLAAQMFPLRASE
eukprot:RCo028102